MDLHTHSTASDGIVSPAALVSSAAARGVRQLALTDHDTVAGLDEADRAARAAGIVLVPGIEFSSQWRASGVHIVGLNIDPSAPVLAQAAAEQQAVRAARAATIGERLAKAGFAGALAGAEQVAAAQGAQTLGRPHFAAWLVAAGHASSKAQAFRRWLGKGKVGDVPTPWPDVATVVDWIQTAGGVAVLAHPLHYRMTLTKLTAMLADFRSAGGRAMEVISGVPAAADIRRMADLCRRQGLWASQGSDCHDPGQAWQAPGCTPPLPDDLPPVWEHWSA